MLNSLLRVSGLDVFGDKLMNTRVRRYLSLQVSVIVLNFFVDWYLWAILFAYAIGEGAVAKFFGFVLAFAIAGLEWTIAIQDTTENLRRATAMFLGRVALMLVFAGFTSTVFDLKFFETEIMGEITRQEKIDADKIREEAIAGIEADYAARLEEKKSALAGQPDDVKTTRKADYATLLASQKERRAEIQGRLTAKSAEVAKQAKLTGRRSNPAALSALRKQEAEIRKELSDFDAAAKSERSEFEAATDSMTSGAIASVQAANDAVLAERDGKIAAVRALSQAELAEQYPGDWVKSRGVMDQYRTLKHLIATDPTNAFVATGLFVLGMLLPSVILILKFLAPKAVAKYFSVRAQAIAGNEEALQELREAGVSGSIAQLGHSDDVRAWHQAVQGKRVALREGLIAFGRWFFESCAPSPSTNVSRTRSELTRLSVARWESKVAPLIRELRDLEERARYAGIELAPWPADWEVSDPRVDAERPWTLGNEDLERHFGWVNPSQSGLHSLSRP